MSRVFFIADLHFGHKRIADYTGDLRGGVTDSESHDEWLVENWNNTVKKRDTVFVLGDVAFTRRGLEKIKRLRGRKKLIMGNHDTFGVESYASFFDEILPGIVRYKGMWLSHAPIHPDELRGRVNMHGHVHAGTIPDPRYVNVCVEALGGVPISADEVRSILLKRRVI